jgi:hypothetical protein
MAKKKSDITIGHVISTLFYIRQLADALVTVLMEREGVKTVRDLPSFLLLDSVRRDCPPLPPRKESCPLPPNLSCPPPPRAETCPPPRIECLPPPKLPGECPPPPPPRQRRCPIPPRGVGRYPLVIEEIRSERKGAARLQVFVDRLGRRVRRTQKRAGTPRKAR